MPEYHDHINDVFYDFDKRSPTENLNKLILHSETLPRFPDKNSYTSLLRSEYIADHKLFRNELIAGPPVFFDQVDEGLRFDAVAQPLPREPYEFQIEAQNPLRGVGQAAIAVAFSAPFSLRPTADRVEQQRLDDPKWLVEHAEHVPAGWNKKRLGSIIKTRLKQGVDANLHDATYWLVEFECPERIGEDVMFSKKDEEALVLAAAFGNADEKLPSNHSKVAKLFHDPDLAVLYTAVRALKLVPEGNDHLEGLISPNMPRLKAAFDHCLNYGMSMDQEAQSELLCRLKTMSQKRERFINDAQTWLRGHSTAPRDLLVFAWKNRDLALRAGADDNPTAIKAWADQNTIAIMLEELTGRGEAPVNLTIEDLPKYAKYINELVRCYDARTVIRTVSEHKEIFNPDFIFPAHGVTFDDGWRAEILGKDDPRGYTIGHDTGCCMTVTGQASTCIKAGYSDERYGFFVLYDQEGKVAAQSLIYANPDEDEETIVIDNIETNVGRKRDDVLGRYDSFFENYLAEMKAEGKSLFSRVNLGVHYEETYDLPMKAQRLISTPARGTYSDAKRLQLLLLDIKAEQNNVDLVPLSKNDLVAIEALHAKIYDANIFEFSHRPFDIDSRNDPHNHSHLISQGGGSAIGYVVASEEKIDITGEGGLASVLYIDDLAILPEYQRSGVGGETFRYFVRLAQKLGKSLVFHARNETTWKILESHKGELESLGLQVDVLDEDPHYYSDNNGAHYVLVMPKDKELQVSPS